MIRYRAAWLVPIEGRPIQDGWVVVDDGRIVARAGNEGTAAGSTNIIDRDLGDVAILPGLVNAHTHLELSYLHDQVPPASRFVTWIRAIMAARRERADPEAPEILDAVDRGIAESIACGTAIVGDISNSLVTMPRLIQSPLAAVVFYELIRFNAPDADALVARALDEIDTRRVNGQVRASLAAHAPYSVAPALFAAIKRAVDDGR